MIINNNFTLFKNQQSKPAFKADYFQSIKNLPNMTCGYCGRKTLSIEKYMQSIISTSLPLKKQLEKGVLNYLKQILPKTWEKIKTLAELYPLSTLDEITHSKKAEINNNYVELKSSVVEDINANDEYKNLNKREKHRIIDKIFFDLNDIGRSYMKQCSIVIENLLPIASYLDGEKKKVFEQFEIYSQKYPDKSLSEIVKESDVYIFHLNEFTLQKNEKKQKTNYHFKNILKTVEKNNPENIAKFQELQKQAFKILYSVKGANKRKYLVENLYREAFREHNFKNIEEEYIINELRQIPESYVSKDSFFIEAKDRNFTDAEIVNALFGNLLTSEKHIIELEHGGYDEVGNKIVVCRNCNTRSKFLSYEEKLNYYPDIVKNTQKQIDYITNSLLNNELNERLRAYPIYAVENLKKASNNKIKLDITDYCHKTIKRSKQKVKKNKKIIDWLKDNHDFDATQKKFFNEKEELLQEKIKNFLAGKDNLHHHQ